MFFWKDHLNLPQEPLYLTWKREHLISKYHYIKAKIHLILFLSTKKKKSQFSEFEFNIYLILLCDTISVFNNLTFRGVKMQDAKFGIKKKTHETLCQIKYKVITSNNIIRVSTARCSSVWFFFNMKNSHKYGQEILGWPFMEDLFSSNFQICF